jgi:hypothetical protein
MESSSYGPPTASVANRQHVPPWSRQMAPLDTWPVNIDRTALVLSRSQDQDQPKRGKDYPRVRSSTFAPPSSSSIIPPASTTPPHSGLSHVERPNNHGGAGSITHPLHSASVHNTDSRHATMPRPPRAEQYDRSQTSVATSSPPPPRYSQVVGSQHASHNQLRTGGQMDENQLFGETKPNLELGSQ